MKSSCIGVLGGSFNPIHSGHIELAIKAHEQYKMPKILLMPTFKSYYKDSSVYAGSDQRLQMTALAACECGSGFLEASSMDIDRGKITYTCDTVDELSRSYKEIFFIVGSDSLMYIDKWKNADIFLRKCVILYAQRKGDNVNELKNKADYLKNHFHADVREIKNVNVPVSSSDIRSMIKKGNSISGLVPESVEKYIKDNNLYK